MPRRQSRLPVGRYFATLAGVLVILYLLVFFTGTTHKPKLGLDLQGGTTVTLQARTSNGKPPSSADLSTARSIIEQRVNGRGISNADIVTQGNDQIVISIPGKNTDEAKSVGTTAQMVFRPVVIQISQAAPKTTPATPGSAAPTKPTGSAAPSSARPGSSVGPSGSTAPSTPAPTTRSPAATKFGALPGASQPGSVVPIDDVRTLAAPTGSATARPSSPATASPGKSAPAAPAPTGSAPAHSSDPLASLPAKYAKYKSALAAEVGKSCAQLAQDNGVANPNAPIVACDDTGAKYVLAPSLFPGTSVKGASAQLDPQGVSWQVELDLKGKAQAEWASYTTAHNVQKLGYSSTSNTVPPTICQSNPDVCVAYVLDGRILTSPSYIGSPIAGTTSISGNFTASSAKNLAQEFKYGALPVTFKTLTAQTISATLGTSQLRYGLLAGGIGLILVVLYSLLYYRALGLVTIASLVISGLLVYGFIVLLGQGIGFTLSLAGIAGFIVAVGITADSFVVFFERIKEEVHAGRSFLSSVPRAWKRARRTILTADAVSFLAAAILYYLAAGDVRGFAFTLGLSTILDLVVVFLFTHPLVVVASGSKTFSSPRMTGLKPRRAPRPEPRSAAESAALRRGRLAKES